jgi:hypothetical protein
VALLLLGRLAGRRAAIILTVGCFAARLALGLTLYLVSLYHLPFLPSRQLPGGFWSFTYDGYVFNNRALVAVAHAGKSATAVFRLLRGSPTSLGFDSGSEPTGFVRVLASAYSVFGANPVVGLVLVATAAAAVVPLAFIAARAVGLSEQQCLAVGLLVGLWPSSFLWTTGLLKDSIEWFASMLTTAGVCLLWKAIAAKPKRERASVFLSLGLIGCGELLLATGRVYAAEAWAVALVGSLAVCFLESDFPARTKLKVSLCSLTGLGVVLFARSPMAMYYGHTLVYSLRQAADSRVFRVQKEPLATPVGPLVIDADAAAANEATILVLCESPGLPRGLTDPATGIGYVAESVADVRGYKVSCPPPGHSNSPIDTSSSDDKCPPIAGILNARSGFMAAGGGTQIDDAPLSDCVSALAYSPRAAELVFLWPLPNQWWQLGAENGEFRLLGPLESLLLWVLLPGMLVGVAQAFLRPHDGRLAIAIFVLILGVALGIAVTNFGSLLRIRLTVIMPAIIVAVSGSTTILEKAQAWRSARLGARASAHN